VQSRWDHRVTVVVGGAGFGKSSLLIQACDENALAPRGDDCWLGCGPGDDGLRALARGLADAVDADPAKLPDPDDDRADDPVALAAPIADAVWARAPRHVCLIVDDVHEVGDGPAAAVLRALIDALPRNGHVVLSGRVEPPVPLARLVAQGHAVRIEEAELAFDGDDLAAFADLREVPVGRIDDLGGWPALVELRAAASAGAVDDFLAEEVMAALTPAQQRAVAVVAALGGADQALVDAVEGTGGRSSGRSPGHDLAALLQPVPLVSVDRTGWYEVHAVWADRLADALDDVDRREVQRRAGVALAGRDLAAGVKLLEDAGADDELRAVLRTECRAQDLASSPDRLAQVHAGLPQAVRVAPEGELLAGVAVAGTDLEQATRLLRSAAERFAAAGDDVGLLCAVEHLALCAHWREDVELFGDLWAWGERLAAMGEASDLLAIAEAMVADTRGEAAAVIEALDRIDPATLGPSWQTAVAWLRASAELALGFAVPARRHAAVAVGTRGAALRRARWNVVVNDQAD
jgi:hypothetical protein